MIVVPADEGYRQIPPVTKKPNTFRDAVNTNDFVVTAELPLWPARSRAAIEDDLGRLAGVIDAAHVGVDDRPDSGVAPLVAACIARESGLVPVLHISARDKNRIALQSEIIGAVTAGISSLVVRRGEKLPSLLRGRVKGVFDTKTTQLLAIARRVAEREDLGDGEDLYIGCMVPPVRPSEDWEAALLKEKLENGARFLQTRPIFSANLLQEYAAALVTQKITHRATIIAGIPLLASVASARSISERFPGIAAPDHLLRRLNEASDEREEGIAILAEQLQHAAATPGVSGAAIVNVDDIDAVVEAVKGAGISDYAGTS